MYMNFSSIVLIFSLKINPLVNKITNIESNILNQADADVTKTLLFVN